MTRWTLLALLPVAFGCTNEANWQDLSGPPGDVLRQPTPGIYEGAMFLDVRGYAGKVKVAQRDCTVPFSVEVSPDAVQWFVGKGRDCDLGKQVGILDLTLVTDVDRPYTGEAGGQLGGLDGSWEGWFYGEDLLYAEAAGDTHDKLGRMEYLILAEAVRVGDLPEETLSR